MLKIHQLIDMYSLNSTIHPHWYMEIYIFGLCRRPGLWVYSKGIPTFNFPCPSPTIYSMEDWDTDFLISFSSVPRGDNMTQFWTMIFSGVSRKIIFSGYIQSSSMLGNSMMCEFVEDILKNYVKGDTWGIKSIRLRMAERQNGGNLHRWEPYCTIKPCTALPNPRHFYAIRVNCLSQNSFLVLICKHCPNW